MSEIDIEVRLINIEKVLKRILAVLDSEIGVKERNENRVLKQLDRIEKLLEKQ